MDSSTIVYSACDLIQLFSVLIYPVRTVQKCDYRNSTNRTLIKKGKTVRSEASQATHHVYA